MKFNKFLGCLFSEVDKLSNLKHPPIVQFKGFCLTDFIDERYLVIIQEYLINELLLSIIEQEKQ